MANVIEAQRHRLTKSGKKQAHMTIWGRFVLGLFVSAWLTSSALPCQMAMEVSPDTPIMSEHSGHSAHHQQETGDEVAPGCVHCSPGVDGHEISCASVVAGDCGESPDTSVDGRLSPSKFKDHAQAQSVPRPPPQLAPRTATSRASCPPSGQDKFASGPSLSVRYCVFLK